jgi:hypothetical protein
MIVELIMSKDRVSYIVEHLGEDRVTVSEYNKEQNTIKFELKNTLDILIMFHAGIKCGSDNMAKALIK